MSKVNGLSMGIRLVGLTRWSITGRVRITDTGNPATSTYYKGVLISRRQFKAALEKMCRDHLDGYLNEEVLNTPGLKGKKADKLQYLFDELKKGPYRTRVEGFEVIKPPDIRTRIPGGEEEEENGGEQ